MSYQDLLGQLPTTPIGRDFDPSHPLESFPPTARGVAFHPVEFFGALPRKGTYTAPLVFALVCAEISSVLGGAIGLTGGNSVGWLIGTLVFAAVGATIGLFVIAAIAHLFVTWIVGPTNAGFEGTFRVAAYSSVTGLLSWIPVVGGFVSLYGLYLAIVGIRDLHQTTTGKAAVIVLIPAAIVGAVVLLVIVIAGLALFGALKSFG
jgi:hypothetical protein